MDEEEFKKPAHDIMEKKEMPHPSLNTAAGDNCIKGFY